MDMGISEKKSQIVICIVFGIAVAVSLLMGNFQFYILTSAGLELLTSVASVQSSFDALSRDGFSPKDHAVFKLQIGITLAYWIGIWLFGFVTKGIRLRNRFVYMLLFASQISALAFLIKVYVMGDGFSSFL